MTTCSLPSTDELVVAPGATVSTQLRVRNSSRLVDEFTFQPLGDVADWITVEPPMVRLLPDTDSVVTVTIAPPRAPTTHPGPAAWAVKILSHEDPQDSAVAEGTVLVGEFTDLSAELQPSTAHGRRRGRFELAVDNRGNVPLGVRVAGTDPTQTLAIDTTPAGFDAKPGSAMFSRVKLRPTERIWHGQPKSHSFQLLVSALPSPALPDDRAIDGEGAVVPVVLNATFVQDPVLPKWILKALLLAAALLLLLFVLWKTLLEPTVESAARSVAVEEVDEVDEDVAELAEAVDAQVEEAQQAQENASAAAEEAKAASEEAAEVAAAVQSVPPAEPVEPADSGGILSDTSNPTNFRLSVTAPAGGTASDAWQPDAQGSVFALTDVVLQNPGGNVGRIRVQIDGSTILESALENFRDLDFHFISPYVVGDGADVSVEVDCAVDQLDGAGACSPAVSFAGFTTTPTEER
jgi:hypothetical protein